MESKMSALEKINSLVASHYVVIIQSDTEVFVDDYENGEGESRNSWVNDTNTFKLTTETLSSGLKDAIREYYLNVLELNYTDDELRESLGSYLDQTYFYTHSKLVDVDNTKPSKQQISLWQDGEEELFTHSTTVTISINGIDIPCELLTDLLFPEEEK